MNKTLGGKTQQSNMPLLLRRAGATLGVAETSIYSICFSVEQKSEMLMQIFQSRNFWSFR